MESFWSTLLMFKVFDRIFKYRPNMSAIKYINKNFDLQSNVFGTLQQTVKTEAVINLKIVILYVDEAIISCKTFVYSYWPRCKI